MDRQATQVRNFSAAVARVGTAMLVATFLLQGCAERIRIERRMNPAERDWPMYGGASSRANASMIVLAPPLKPVWEYNAMAGIAGTPIVRDSIVIVGTLQGELHVIRLSDGEGLGSIAFESAIVGTPVWDKSNVFVTVGHGNETLVSISLRDGRKNWAARLGAIETSPLLIGSFLYVTTLDGSLVALMKDDAKEVWRYDYAAKEVRKPVRSSPASDGEVIVFGTDGGDVVAVERLTGRFRWKTPVGASVFASPIIVDGMCIVGTLDGTLFALDVQNGSARWTYETGSKIFASASTSRGHVYLGTADGRIVALDRNSGKEIWAFTAKGPVNSAPLISGDVIYVGSLDRMLYALSAATGEKVWQFEAEGRIRVSPVIWGDMLLLSHEDKFVTAMRPGRP